MNVSQSHPVQFQDALHVAGGIQESRHIRPPRTGSATCREDAEPGMPARSCGRSSRGL